MIDKFQGENRWLSNFEKVNILFENMIFPTTENAYQAAKTLDIIKRRQFLECSPAEAKKLGQTLELRPDWDSVKLGIMKEINEYKYKRVDLGQKLKDTGDQELVEGNTWNDTYWGVCNGKGENHLGKILMEIRSKLNDRS